MPSSACYKRDYKQEYKTKVSRGEKRAGKGKDGKSKSTDAVRDRDRRAHLKATGAKKMPAGKQLDHKKPLNRGGKGGSKNTRVRSASANMAAGGRSGNISGKASGARKANRAKKK